MLRGVNRIAGALAAEVGDKKVDVGRLRLSLCGMFLINPQQEVAGSENLEDFRFDGNVSTSPTV